ncbi:uncharacterized protein LOC123865479 [Maniola jurtina]|uniref:uncharacterized protein LOC123865479 n=1 Tax=Maniola jurtina TaxID=191418 RepID=UPI001E68719B|nr:uncharacterized protein LOC123865479 [Maniola jurtina]
MTLKILFFSVFLLFAGIVSARNVTLGNPSEGKLLYHQKFEKIPKPDVTEISRGTINIKDGVITAIVIQDLQGDGRSFVLSGGIGESKVKIELIGERGTGFKFIVDVYGKPSQPSSKLKDLSKDKSDKVDEPKGKSLNPDELSEDKSENPDEGSKNKSDKVDDSKDKSKKPDEVSKDKSEKPSKDKMKLIYTPAEA